MSSSFYSYVPGGKHIRDSLAKGNLLFVLLENKHENQEFIVASEKGLLDLCLSVLKERMDSGDYYSDPNDPDNQPGKPSMTMEQAESLPEGRVKIAAMEEIASHKRAYAAFNREKDFWDDAHKAIQNNAGWLALECLVDRMEGQYEGIRISTPQVFK